MSSNAQEQHGDDHPIVGHLVPMSILVWTTIALLFLTVVTVAVRYVDVGEFNIVIAIGIAVLKATLVALFFMHLKWDRPFNQIVFVACMRSASLPSSVPASKPDAREAIPGTKREGRRST